MIHDDYPTLLSYMMYYPTLLSYMMYYSWAPNVFIIIILLCKIFIIFWAPALVYHREISPWDNERENFPWRQTRDKFPWLTNPDVDWLKWWQLNTSESKNGLWFRCFPNVWQIKFCLHCTLSGKSGKRSIKKPLTINSVDYQWVTNRKT